ncbi:MAG: OmpP1/FadL family transporter [Candidatus Omnitrophota bacterium]
MISKKALVLLLLFLPTALCAPEARAGGFLSLDQGQPSTGTAEAGQAALANDASTAYFNPAGMARLERSEVLMGAQLSFLSVEFHSDGNNSFRGSDGGSAGGIYPGGGFYYVQKLSPLIDAGLSINAPAGLGANYHDNWKGRYFIQNSFLAIVDIDPVLSLRLADWLSVGGGVDIYYAFMNEEIALFNPRIIRPNQPDGKIKLRKLDDWSVGWNLGVLLEPWKTTRAGVMYRSGVDFDLKGDIDFDNIGTIWNFLGLEDTYGLTSLTLPMSITASLYQDITDKFAVLLDTGWQDWSSMEKTQITTNTGKTALIERNWRDIWRIGGGVHYRLVETLLLKAGISYDSSPTDKDDRLPDMAIDRQWKYALGLEYDLNKDITINANWAFVDLGKAPIDKTVAGDRRRLSGDYDQFANVINVSFRWRFGK